MFDCGKENRTGDLRIMSVKNLLENDHIYKPFSYPWAFEAWAVHERMHWLFDEVKLGDDVKDWNGKLSESERNLLTQIFRFFTQADVEVSNCYNKKYAGIFGPTEVQMMLSGFSNREAVHIASYSYLLDTIGMPEVEYQAFLKYDEMKAKFDYMQTFSTDNKFEIAKTMAMFGAFTEGLSLFASFAILLNFPRFNKMKGMGQIISWSVRDETVHCDSITRLFREFVSENPELWDDKLKGELYTSCSTVVEHEDNFIDLAFEMGDIEGLTREDMKQYIRFIANRRLHQLGLKEIYDVKKNPLNWLPAALNAPEFANFFEARVTEYGKAATVGTWEDAFELQVYTVYSKEGCPNCDKTKELFDKYMVAYNCIDLTNDKDKRIELYANYGKSTLPIILKGSKFIGGYEELGSIFNGSST